MISGVCLTLLFLAVAVAFVRLVKGPQLVDRSVAFDVIASALILMLIILGMTHSVPHAFMIFLTLSFLIFLGTLALAALIERTGRLQGLEESAAQAIAMPGVTTTKTGENQSDSGVAND